MTGDSRLHDIGCAGWRLHEPAWNTLSDYERGFAHLELSGQRTLDYYRSRLRGIGFERLECVLDAGCGIGQWSITLADLNARVHGVDLSPGRISLARLLGREHEKTNATFQLASLEKLPFMESTFDAVFCYGVFMFTDMPTVLGELKRVLKTGGLVYVNANGWGWYLHLLFDLGLRQRRAGMVRAAMRFTLRGLLGTRSHAAVTETGLRQLFLAAGLEVIASGAEGTTRLQPGRTDVAPAYPARYYGAPAVIEILARKPR